MTAALAFIFAFAGVVVFSVMWIQGAVVATESNPYIRGLELAICVAGASFGIYSLVKEVNEVKLARKVKKETDE
jgi:hypothetical protein